MTYSAGSPGYPPPPPVPGYGPARSTQRKPTDHGGGLSSYLTGAVAALGFFAYLGSFGPEFILKTEIPGLSVDVSGATLDPQVAIVAALGAGLLAAVGLLPTVKRYLPVVTVLSVLSLLVAIDGLLSIPDGVSIGWGLWLALGCIAVQASAAVTALLLDVGLLKTSAPAAAYPGYPPYGPYGQYPGQQARYYGQQGARPSGPQPVGYPAPGPGYGPGSAAPMRPQNPNGPSGGYPGQAATQSGPSPIGNDGPPTPPTGFPTFSAPPAAAGAASEAPVAGDDREGDADGAQHRSQDPTSQTSPPGSA